MTICRLFAICSVKKKLFVKHFYFDLQMLPTTESNHPTSLLSDSTWVWDIHPSVLLEKEDSGGKALGPG